MTAFPDHDHLVATAQADGFDGHVGRPAVTETFWGYEIAPGEVVIDAGVLGRIVLLVVSLGAAIAAPAIWLMPAMAFVGHAVLGKAALSAGFAALAMLGVMSTALGGRVRLQVDTGKGELREIVRNIFGQDMVLASYGFDAVEGIDLRQGQGRAQIVLRVAGAGEIPAGDGHAVMLGGLRHRLETDLGLDRRDGPVIPDFAGPLVR